eukprot:1161934-Pelagomonas_calceolata.AAC.7
MAPKTTARQAQEQMREHRYECKRTPPPTLRSRCARADVCARTHIHPTVQAHLLLLFKRSRCTPRPRGRPA